MADDATTDTTPADNAENVQTTPQEPQGTEQQKVTDDDGNIDWKAASRKHEDAAKKAREEAKANAAAAKELADLKAAQMSDAEKKDAALKAAAEETASVKAELARERAARKYNLTDDDLAILDGLPAEKFEDAAKKLAARNKAATNAAGTSGAEVGGGKPSTTEMDPAKIAANAANRKPQVRIF